MKQLQVKVVDKSKTGEDSQEDLNVDPLDESDSQSMVNFLQLIIKKVDSPPQKNKKQNGMATYMLHNASDWKSFRDVLRN